MEIKVNDISPNQDEEATELKSFLFNTINNREWIYPNQVQEEKNNTLQTSVGSDTFMHSSVVQRVEIPSFPHTPRIQLTDVHFPETNYVKEESYLKNSFVVHNLIPFPFSNRFRVALFKGLYLPAFLF